MTCRTAIDLLADYLDAALPRDTGDRLEAHLDGCDACTAYLRTYRRTRALTRRAGDVRMPAELQVRLRDFLLAQLRREDDPAGADGDRR